MNQAMQELLINSVTRILLFGISAFAFVQAVSAFMKERSVGKAAVQKLKDEHSKIKEEVERVKEKHADLKEEVDEITDRYESFINKLLSNFPFNK